MAAIMKNMELIKADAIPADSLQIGDIINYNDEFVEIISIESDSTGDIYSLELKNDFGEKEIVEYQFDELVDWYVYLD